jgi:hypothetical protein
MLDPDPERTYVSIRTRIQNTVVMSTMMQPLSTFLEGALLNWHIRTLAYTIYETIKQ